MAFAADGFVGERRWLRRGRVRRPRLESLGLDDPLVGPFINYDEHAALAKTHATECCCAMAEFLNL
jgi:hypothetical protein